MEDFENEERDGFKVEVNRPGKKTTSGKKSNSAKNKFNKIGFTEELVDDDIEEDI